MYIAHNTLSFALRCSYDTTKIALSFALFALANHARVQDALRAEIFATLGAQRDDASTLDSNLTSGMKYLDMVFKETVRFACPPLMPRTLVQDLRLGSHTIPARTQLFLYVHGLHHDVRHWQCPDVFEPERFAPEAVRLRHKFAYLPFGYGKRSCIGERFAKQYFKQTLIVLLRKYRVLPVTEWHEIELCFAPVLGTKEPIQIRFEKLQTAQ